jgi:glutamate/aspartate transport system permease protein
MNPLAQQYITALICLGLFTAARRRASTCRDWIAARGQKNAGLAMGLTLPQTYRFVLLPMAYRIIVPPLTSEFLNIFKNSAVATTIGFIELSRQAQQLVDFTAQPYESFIAVTLLYLMINVVVMLLMRWVEGRTRVPGFIGSK